VLAQPARARITSRRTPKTVSLRGRDGSVGAHPRTQEIGLNSFFAREHIYSGSFLREKASDRTGAIGAGFPTKDQLIIRKEGEPWSGKFPPAIATGMDFAEGETVEWTVADKQHLILSRHVVSADPFKFRKNAAAVSPENSHPNESKA